MARHPGEELGSHSDDLPQGAEKMEGSTKKQEPV